jgi:RsiW-degrading membrane proteinase PrsW (M82 family)
MVIPFMERLAAFAVAMGPALAIAPILLALGSRLSSRGTTVIAIAMGLMAALGSLVGLIFLPLVAAIKLPILQLAVKAFLAAAAPEEAAKLLILMTIVLRHHEAVAQRDSVLLAGWLGLGFALFENFFYVTQGKSWLMIGTMRAVTAVPTHVALGLIMGRYLTRAMQGRSALLLAFCVPAALHGLYDWALMQLAAASAPFSIATLIWGCVLAVTLIITWLFVRGPVCDTLRELQAAFGTAAIDPTAPEERIANALSLLLQIAAGLVLVIAAVAAFTIKFEYGAIGFLAVMPLAFADLWRRGGRVARKMAALPVVEPIKIPLVPSSATMQSIERDHRPTGPLIPQARIAMALGRRAEVIDETG